jgi:hypothetical protein
MKPKLAYLIDEGSHFGDPSDWKFYTEVEVPSYKLEHASSGTIKRIVYWEIEDEA